MASASKQNSAKSSASLWTKENTMQLIALYKSSEDLWNTGRRLYCNRNHKKKLQNEIAAKLKIDVKETAIKMHNLRCQYNGELRKIKQRRSDSGSGEVYVSRWQYFNALKFLSRSGNSFSLVDECNSNSDLSFPPRGSFRKKKAVPQAYLQKDELLNKGDNSFSLVDECNSSSEISFPPRGSFRRKQAEPQAYLQKDALLNNAMKILGAPADSHQIFGDYVADQLRNMAENKRKRLKLIIQKAIIELEEESDDGLTSPSASSTQNHLKKSKEHAEYLLEEDPQPFETIFSK